VGGRRLFIKARGHLLRGRRPFVKRRPFIERGSFVKRGGCLSRGGHTLRGDHWSREGGGCWSKGGGCWLKGGGCWSKGGGHWSKEGGHWLREGGGCWSKEGGCLSREHCLLRGDCLSRAVCQEEAICQERGSFVETVGHSLRWWEGKEEQWISALGNSKFNMITWCWSLNRLEQIAAHDLMLFTCLSLFFHIKHSIQVLVAQWNLSHVLVINVLTILVHLCFSRPFSLLNLYLQGSCWNSQATKSLLGCYLTFRAESTWTTDTSGKTIKVYGEMSWKYWRLLGLWTNELGVPELLGATKATDFLNKTTQVHIPSENYIYFCFFPDVRSFHGQKRCLELWRVISGACYIMTLLGSKLPNKVLTNSKL